MAASGILRVHDPSVLRLQLRRPDLQLRPDFVGFIRSMVRRPTTAGNLVPFQETSSLAGGCSHPTAGPPVASAPEEFCSSTLLFLKDILSDREFLVDSGASVSVFPGPRSSSNDGVCLLTADGSPMV